MDFALPLVFAIAAWWLSTVLILYRAGLPRASFRATFYAAGGVALLGLALLIASRNDATMFGAYLSFLGALAVWGWHEVSYLFGFISGPRPEACPPDASGWRRFVLGVQACAYHELAIVATALAIAALTWGAANQTGFWAFTILWLMRWSAKLNIFLGVRNLHEEFWPEHLAYLKSFVRRRPMNELFPVSVCLALAGIGLLAYLAVTAGDDGGQRTAAVLLATLLTLAMLEHFFLVLRVRDDALWRAGMRSRRDARPAAN